MTITELVLVVGHGKRLIRCTIEASVALQSMQMANKKSREFNHSQRLYFFSSLGSAAFSVLQWSLQDFFSSALHFSESLCFLS